MQRRTTLLAMCSFAATLALAGAPRLAAQTGTVTCESRGASREQCPIDHGARVELTRHLSSTPCRENGNWGVGQGFIWVSGGCRAEFTVRNESYGAGQGNPPGQASQTVSQTQLRACRSEADRRLPDYRYDQIQVEPESWQGSVSYVRWRAGGTSGLCTVTSNGRIVKFLTTNGAGQVGGEGAYTETRVTCESRSGDREECRIPRGARVKLVKQLSQSPCRSNDTYGTGDGYLWVAKGCRAEFVVSRGSKERPPE